jgi:hypothetical protein
LDTNGIETYRVAVARAVQVVGGLERLSHRLRVPVAELMRWVQGESTPPDGIFLQVIDVLIEHSGQRVIPSATQSRA